MSNTSKSTRHLCYNTMIKITSLQANWQYFRFWVQLSSNEFGHDQHFAAFAMLLFLCRIVARLPAVRQGRALSWRCSEDHSDGAGAGLRRLWPLVSGALASCDHQSQPGQCGAEWCTEWSQQPQQINLALWDFRASSLFPAFELNVNQLMTLRKVNWMSITLGRSIADLNRMEPRNWDSSSRILAWRSRQKTGDYGDLQK